MTNTITKAIRINVINVCFCAGVYVAGGKKATTKAKADNAKPKIPITIRTALDFAA